MLKAPPAAKLRKFFRKTVTLSKFSLANGTDAYGQKVRTVSGTYSLRAEIQEIVAEDLQFLPPGVDNIGDAFGFFLPSYSVKGKTIAIAAEDEITWSSKTWRIAQIEDFFIGNKLCYKRALMRRVI